MATARLWSTTRIILPRKSRRTLRKHCLLLTWEKRKLNPVLFQITAKSSFNLIPDGARVLVLRSVRNWMIRLILENLNKKTRVDLLGQNVSAKDLEDLQGLNQIYSYGSLDSFQPNQFPPI